MAREPNPAHLGFQSSMLDDFFEKKKENTQTLRIQETFVKLYIIKYEHLSNSLMHVNEEEKLFTVIFGL